MHLLVRLPFGLSLALDFGQHRGRAFTDGVHVYSARTLAEAQALAMEGVYLDWREVWNLEWREVQDNELLPVSGGYVRACDWTRASGDMAVLWEGGSSLK